ncbi:hypothetical protein Ahia01_000617100 [Argonauta hians]
MPEFCSRVQYIKFLLVLLPILAALCTANEEDDTKSLLGQIISKRNSWWSKKSSFPFAEHYPVSDLLSLEEMRCDQTKYFFNCYVRLCVSELVSCAKESKRPFDECTLDYRKCGLKCMSGISSLSK